MDINRALRELGVDQDQLSAAEIKSLDEKGFAVFPGIIDSQWLGALRERFETLCQKEGAAAGLEVHQEAGTRRLADLVNKGEAFDRVYTHPKILAGGSPRYRPRL